MNYNEALDFIHNIPRFQRPLGNAKLVALLEKAGNPQDKLRFVHVAGTNGKGSVCAMTAEILKCAGYKTGLFTSPFLEVFNERIRIDGEMISDDKLAMYTEELSGFLTEYPVSEFAFITAVAMKYFADECCDIVVLETGMGGRLDATNVINAPLVSVLTSISLDHTEYLGDTIEEIAAEKCGIIKSGCEVVSVPNTAVQNIIAKYAKEAGANITFCENALMSDKCFIYKTWLYPLALEGSFQAENASAAVETAFALKRCGLNIGYTDIYNALTSVRWRGRFEAVSPDIIIDGAHNLDAMRMLRKSLEAKGRPVTVVIAMMRDKDVAECVREIAGLADNIVATEVAGGRSVPADELFAMCAPYVPECAAEPDIELALKTAVDMAGDRLICICGSLYLVGEAERILRNDGIFTF